MFLNRLLLIILILAIHSCGQNKKNEIMKFEIEKSENDWRKQLSADQFDVLRNKGTERPFSGKWLTHNESGKYICAGCGQELFSDQSKFDSHCGWPSFDQEIGEGRILKIEDRSHGMVRTEIVCAKCGGHLGHLFDDGPTASGLRYCVNSLSLDFIPSKQQLKKTNMDTITFGGGCYWCTEAIFLQLKGVYSVTSGFSGGQVKNPSYKEVCTGQTGHAEVVQIVYNSDEIPLAKILQVFFATHDPTTLNRQGADIGTQYRSTIFYRNDYQEKLATEIISKLSEQKIYSDPIVTTVVPFEAFYKAEDYHQNYYNQNKEQPYCQAVITPKVEKFEKVFKELLK
jgi:peptide methionine sulfoxide reductase msrA/msrB